MDIGDDLILPFQIEAQGLRGRLARLGPLADEILHRHAYPASVARLLAEMLGLAALLAVLPGLVHLRGHERDTALADRRAGPRAPSLTVSVHEQAATRQDG